MLHWSVGEKFVSGKRNVKCRPLMDPQLVCPPLLHMKLGLVKNVVKSSDKNSDDMKYLMN
jgi:hypothetical protein